MYNNQYDAIRMMIERLNNGFASIVEEQRKLELLLVKLIETSQHTNIEVQNLRSELTAARNQIGKLSRSIRRRMYD